MLHCQLGRPRALPSAKHPPLNHRRTSASGTTEDDEEAQLVRALQLSLLDAPSDKPEAGPCTRCGEEVQDAEAELLRRALTADADVAGDGAAEPAPSPLALARRSVALHAGQEQQAVQSVLQAAGGAPGAGHSSRPNGRQS